MRFPGITGTNLLRQKLTLQVIRQGELNILFIAFQQWHQAWVDSWVPTARQLEQVFPGVQFYELPVIWKMNRFSQTFINEGMRAGIPNQATRQKTITLYTDKGAFRQALDLPNEESIYVLLVDRQGNVLWRTEGAYSEEKGEALKKAIQENYRVNYLASS